MREIKFRGKGIDGVWRFGDYFNTSASKYCQQLPTIIENGGENLTNFYLVIPETVGQFTGLTDKNGKEIYEGDIIKHRFKRPWKTEYHESKVYWNQVWFCFYLFDGTSDYRMRDDIEYEVIGNVFESNNPELLNEKQ